MGEELKYGAMFIVDGGGNWVPLGDGSIEACDPFDEIANRVANAPVRTAFNEDGITAEVRLSGRYVVRIKRLVFGWKARGPLRVKNLIRAGKLKGRALAWQ